MLQHDGRHATLLQHAKVNASSSFDPMRGGAVVAVVSADPKARALLAPFWRRRLSGATESTPQYPDVTRRLAVQHCTRRLSPRLYTTAQLCCGVRVRAWVCLRSAGDDCFEVVHIRQNIPAAQSAAPLCA